jgi:hypothetical protein
MTCANGTRAASPRRAAGSWSGTRGSSSRHRRAPTTWSPWPRRCARRPSRRCVTSRTGDRTSTGLAAAAICGSSPLPDPEPGGGDDQLQRSHSRPAWLTGAVSGASEKLNLLALRRAASLLANLAAHPYAGPPWPCSLPGEPGARPQRPPTAGLRAGRTTLVAGIDVDIATAVGGSRHLARRVRTRGPATGTSAAAVPGLRPNECSAMDDISAEALAHWRKSRTPGVGKQTPRMVRRRHAGQRLRWRQGVRNRWPEGMVLRWCEWGRST